MKKYNQSHGKVNKEEVKLANREDELETIAVILNKESQRLYKDWKFATSKNTKRMKELHCKNRVNVVDFKPDFKNVDLFPKEFLRTTTSFYGDLVPVYSYVSIIESLVVYCNSNHIHLPYNALYDELKRFSEHVRNAPEKFHRDTGFMSKVKRIFIRDFNRNGICRICNTLIEAPEFICIKRLSLALRVLLARKGEEALEVKELGVCKFFRTEDEDLDTIREKLTDIVDRCDAMIKDMKEREKKATCITEEEKKEFDTSFYKSAKEEVLKKVNVVDSLKQIDNLLNTYKDDLRLDIDTEEYDRFREEEVKDLFRGLKLFLLCWRNI